MVGGTPVRAPGPQAKATPSWRKVYEVDSKTGWLTSVWADDDLQWVAAGSGVLITGGTKGVESQSLGERTVVGFAGKSHQELRAVGWDELIMRLDQGKWVSEHFAAGPPRGERGRNNLDLLQQAVRLPVAGRRSQVAFGPHLVLIRQSDGTWRRPPEAEREDLLRLAHAGPRIDKPAGCAGADWDWVDDEAALFTCHDNRTFLYRQGQTTSLGVLPRRCHAALQFSATRAGQVYTLCDGSIVSWNGKRWHVVSAPARLESFAVTARCFYAVSSQVVWSVCDP
jgi:hypothetical protein